MSERTWPPGTSPFRTPPGGVDKSVITLDRLAILDEIVAGGGGAAFQDLRFYLDLSPSGLNNHLAKLEEAGLVRVEKAIVGKRPLTRAVMTEQGRRAYEDLDARFQEFSRRNKERKERGGA